MTKNVFFLLFSFIFIFANCPLKEGTIVEIPCKVVDMQGNPLKDVTLSLINSDSFPEPLNAQLEKQKTTDSKGEVIFVYEHSRLLQRFIRGEVKGSLKPIELYALSGTTGSQVKPIFHYDSLVPITIRLISTLPRMQSGHLDVLMDDRESNNRFLLKQDFSISSNRIDTLFKANMFSQPLFNIGCTLKSQDTIITKTITIPQATKRDSVLTIQF